MIVNKLFKLRHQGIEDEFISTDNSGFRTVTAGQVLRGDDRYLLPGKTLNEQDLRVVVGKIYVLHDLFKELPQVNSLVCRLTVKQDGDGVDLA